MSNIPSIVYKYLTFSSAKNLLNGEVFFSKAPGFEEHEKSRVIFTEELCIKQTTTEEKKWRYRLILPVKQKGSFGWLLCCGSATDGFMWQFCADNSRGISIGINCAKIKQYAAKLNPAVNNNPKRISGYYVICDDLQETCNTKFSEYEFEEDYTIGEVGQFKDSFPRAAISEVIFGFDVPDLQILEVMNLVRDLQKIKFFKYEKSGNIIQLASLDSSVYKLDLAHS